MPLRSEGASTGLGRGRVLRTALLTEVSPPPPPRALPGGGGRRPLPSSFPHHLRTFSMAAITRLISSLARLRVSARTDRPDMLLLLRRRLRRRRPRRGGRRRGSSARPDRQGRRGQGRSGPVRTMKAPPSRPPRRKEGSRPGAQGAGAGARARPLRRFARRRRARLRTRPRGGAGRALGRRAVTTEGRSILRGCPAPSRGRKGPGSLVALCPGRRRRLSLPAGCIPGHNKVVCALYTEWS